MKEMVFVLCFVASIVLFSYVLYKVADKFFSWYYTNRDNKRRKEHPELYRLFDAVDEKGGECCRWFNENISPKKRLVDKMLTDLPYLPEAKRIEAEKEIEKVRQEIYIASITDKVLEDERKELCEQIKSYVAKHNVEWARQMGW